MQKGMKLYIFEVRNHTFYINNPNPINILLGFHYIKNLFIDDRALV